MQFSPAVTPKACDTENMGEANPLKPAHSEMMARQEEHEPSVGYINSNTEFPAKIDTQVEKSTIFPRNSEFFRLNSEYR